MFKKKMEKAALHTIPVHMYVFLWAEVSISVSVGSLACGVFLLTRFNTCRSTVYKVQSETNKNKHTRTIKKTKSFI